MDHVDLLRMPAVAISKDERAFFKRLGARVAETGDDTAEVRLISAREATRNERRQYENG